MIGYEKFPREIQFTNYTCAPCSAYAIASFFGVGVGYSDVKDALGTTVDGTTTTPIVQFLRACGLRVSPRDRMTWRELRMALTVGSVVLVDLDGDHCGVVHGIDSNRVYLADPSPVRQVGRHITVARFKRRWTNSGIAVRPRSRMRSKSKSRKF